MKKKIIASAIAALGLLASSGASAIIVGGVDFGFLGDDPFNRHFETTTIAETLINGDDQTLIGYGQVTTVNGSGIYAGTNSLYFTFEYTSINFEPDSVDFINGVVNIYLGPTINLLNQSSANNLTTIQGYQEWVSLLGHADQNGAEIAATGTLTGSVLAFTGAGLLDVDTSGDFGIAAVASFLDANTIDDLIGGLADISLSTSGTNNISRLNVLDDLTGCFDGTASPGTWCFAGSADLSGGTVTVPEPATLALLGMGLLGMGAAMRRRKA